MAAVLTVSVVASAKVWRINYDENVNADFRTITAACADANVAEGDTLYCEPGGHQGATSDNIISRNGLKIFGPGWGYEPNYGSTSTMAAASFKSEIQIKASNVKLSGLVATEINILAVTEKCLKDITIDRCKCKEIGTTTYPFRDTIRNLTINGCYITTKIKLSNMVYLKDAYIQNNIIYCTSSTCVNCIELTRYASTDIVDNINILRNTIWAKHSCELVYANNSLIQDNIIINNNQTYGTKKVLSGSGNTIHDNVLSLDSSLADNAEIVANYPDNIYGATEASVFTCESRTEYGIEEYFLLKDDSPAKNAAHDDTDCGAFSGSTPYVIGSRPQGIPYLHDVNVPEQAVGNTLTVTFKVANQNE